VTSSVPPYPQEALLIGAIGEMSGSRVLCTSPGLAQFAGEAAERMPRATVSCSYLDQYHANLARNHWREAPPNLQIVSASELPENDVDIVAFPFSANGEAELTRDLIQAGHLRLQLGGKMYASTNNRDDTWLGEQLRLLFRKIEPRQSSQGTLYLATKTEPLKRVRNFACEFAFRDRRRLIRACSRPGVFSHRSIDPGARHLINEMQVASGARVLDIGCGSGVVSLAAACRAAGVSVHAVDSNCRAIECTNRGAELNGFTNVTTELNDGGGYFGSGTYDLALANPPYYANFRIAEHFLVAGRQALRPGGVILVVTKQPDWYRENMPQWFDQVTGCERKGYHIFRGIRSQN
jgi:16S rRNA (guanine1207-N2)-methyltransferase